MHTVTHLAVAVVVVAAAAVVVVVVVVVSFVVSPLPLSPCGSVNDTHPSQLTVP